MTRWYAAFERAVIVLLIANTLAFVAGGTASEGLDSIAWLTLLLLFKLETSHPERLARRYALRTVHAVRLVAATAVVAAAVGYVDDAAWLDAANAWLWIAVVVLLELQVRFARALAGDIGLVRTIAAMLYLALAALVIVWAWRGEWFDAYDAALWLVAFVTIEMKMLTRPALA
jgi:hypothetical protein